MTGPSTKNLCQSEIRNLQAGSRVGDETLRAKGQKSGRDGLPMSSHKGLDTEELKVLAAYKALLKQCWQQFRDDISKAINQLDSRLFYHSSTEEHTADTGASLGQARINESEARLAQIPETKRQQLLSASERANEANKNLTEFRDQHKLTRPADYSRNLLKHLLIGVSVIALVALLLSFIVRGWDEFLLSVALWLIVTPMIAAVSYALAEAWRGASNNIVLINWAATGTVIVLILLGFAVSLGLGHYRDALSSVPTQSIVADPTDEDGLNDSAAEQSDCSQITSPTTEAICRLRRDALRLEDLYSVFVVIISILSIAAAYRWWYSADDPYFRYGRLSRRSERRMAEWRDVYGPAISRLDRERQALRAGAESAYVDLRTEWESGMRQCDDLYEGWEQALPDIGHACRDSLLAYRTANREARPPAIEPPPHWDDEWDFPLDDEYTLPNREELRGPICTHEEAVTLAKQENANLHAVLDAIDAAHKKSMEQIAELEPKPASFPSNNPA